MLYFTASALVSQRRAARLFCLELQGPSIFNYRCRLIAGILGYFAHGNRTLFCVLCLQWTAKEEMPGMVVQGIEVNHKQTDQSS